MSPLTNTKDSPKGNDLDFSDTTDLAPCAFRLNIDGKRHSDPVLLPLTVVRSPSKHA
jgi:hypothetical protein